MRPMRRPPGRGFGSLRALGLPVIDTANFLGYIMWSMWLIALAIVIVVYEHRAATTQLRKTATALT